MQLPHVNLNQIEGSRFAKTKFDPCSRRSVTIVWAKGGCVGRLCRGSKSPLTPRYQSSLLERHYAHPDRTTHRTEAPTHPHTRPHTPRCDLPKPNFDFANSLRILRAYSKTWVPCGTAGGRATVACWDVVPARVEYAMRSTAMVAVHSFRLVYLPGCCTHLAVPFPDRHIEKVDSSLQCRQSQTVADTHLPWYPSLRPHPQSREVLSGEF